MKYIRIHVYKYTEHMKYIRIHAYKYTERTFAAGCNLACRDRKPKYKSRFSKRYMAVMASDCPSPHFPFLHLGLTTPQPSRRHHAQSLLGPSFHDPRTPHVLESHPERAVPLSCTKGLYQIMSYSHIPLFSKVFHLRRRVSRRRHMYLPIVGSDYCVMLFVYTLHMRRQNLALVSCLYTKPFELVIEVIFYYCTTPPCHKINLFKRPFRVSRFEHLDDALVLLISLIFLYLQKILNSFRAPFEL